MVLKENPAPPTQPDTAWQCGVCMKWHPVTSMARECERKHGLS